MIRTNGSTKAGDAKPSVSKTQIVVLGGGFGGVYTARRLEKLCARRPEVEIVVVSRDNFFLMYPLLFEVCSGTLEMRHCCVPIRAFLRKTRFVEAAVESIDLDRRVIHTAAVEGAAYDLPYDQLVLALGSMTNETMIPGSEHAFTFKTVADAVSLRNHLIERFERADVETDPMRKRTLLTIVVIGGGLVGIELFGELTAFVDEIIQFYRHVSRDEVRFLLLQAIDRIMPEIDSKLADYATRVLTARLGVEIRKNAPVRAVEPGKVHLKDETIEAGTIVLAVGTVPSPVVAGLPVEKDKHGRIVVAATMRCESAGNLGLGRLRVRSRARRQTLSGPRPARLARGKGAGFQHSRRPDRQIARAVCLSDDRSHGLARPQKRVGPSHEGSAPRLLGVVGATDLLPLSDAWLGPSAADRHRLDLRAAVQRGHRQDRPRRRARLDLAEPTCRRNRRRQAGRLQGIKGDQ